MNLSSNMISIVAALCAGTAFAQSTGPITDPLVVGVGMQEEERYVERSVQEEEDAIQLLENASYTGHNIMLSGAMTGILANGSKVVKLDADEGTWNRIAAFQHGIYLTDMEEESLISNTKVEMREGPYLASSTVWAIRIEGSQTATRLNNVIVDMTGISSSVYSATLLAIGASDGANLCNDGGISITYGHTRANQAAIGSYTGSKINFHHVDISMKKGISVVAGGSGSVYLTDSRIEAESDNILILGGSGGAHNVVTLDHVDLSKALDQRIAGSRGEVTINFINGTKFDGYAATDYFDPTSGSWMGEGSISLNIDTRASWNVTRYSDLGELGSLSLSGDSAIYFHSDGAGDFMNINSASVMLAEGSLLQLDMDSSTFVGGEILTLFTGVLADGFTNEGMILASADGYSLEYIDHGNGQFELTGVMSKLVPEPSTAALGLLGLLTLASRRRRA